ncbi:MAG: hypothetical protein JO062_23060 [Bryobacterales bacterium]|nr:hypothetical protein [Bryobacterales bacterium]
MPVDEVIDEVISVREFQGLHHEAVYCKAERFQNAMCSILLAYFARRRGDYRDHRTARASCIRRVRIPVSRVLDDGASRPPILSYYLSGRQQAAALSALIY